MTELADLTPSQLTPANVSAWMVARVERELAGFAAADASADAAAAQLAKPPAPAPQRPGSSNGTSVVFTVRLDVHELEALQRRAAARGLRPSVLARNLIRLGLQRRPLDDRVGDAVDQLEAAVAVYRAVVPAH